MRRLTKFAGCFITVLLLLSGACTDSSNNNDNGNDSGSGDFPNLTKVDYETTDDIFVNPERGWYKNEAFHFNGAVPTPMNTARVKQLRGQGYSLILNIYYMHDFREKDLSAEFLNVVESNMQALREGGCKTVLRFAYTNNEDQKPWDASQEQAHRHIAQLKPILREYSDVIYVMEAGFVGVWGEWYYTDNFNFQPSGKDDYTPRKELLEGLLDALPDDRMVCVRTPNFKLSCFALNYADSLTINTAHKGTKLSRLAAHNDCFLASADDYGTFRNNKDRDFWSKETKYVVMGGETCTPTDAKYYTCENSISDMEKYHFSYLNQGYHETMISSWKQSGCFDEISKRLGYRLSLKEGYFTKTPKVGEEFEVVLKIENEGFAAPMNPRGIELVFVEKGNTSVEYRVALNDDPRFWFAGEEHFIKHKFAFPEGMEAGKSYNIYLNLPDPKSILADKPEFSIRLANKDVWRSATGYNKIHSFKLD